MALEVIHKLLSCDLTDASCPRQGHYVVECRAVLLVTLPFCGFSAFGVYKMAGLQPGGVEPHFCPPEHLTGPSADTLHEVLEPSL